MSSSSSAAAAGPAKIVKKSVAPPLEEMVKHMSAWVYQAPAKNKKETGMLGYINKEEGSIDNAAFQFGHVAAWLLPALGRASEVPAGQFVCTFPFGVSDPYDKTKVGVATRLNLQCSFKSEMATEAIHKLEAHHIAQNIKNVREWFPKMFELKKKDLESLMKEANTDEDKATRAAIAAIDDKVEKKAAQAKFEDDVMYRNAVAQMEKTWKSNLSESDKYDNTFRGKINTTASADGPATEIMLLSLENGKPVMSKGAAKHITKHSRGIPIFEQTPGLWYQPTSYGCSYTITKLLLIPAPPKNQDGFDLDEFGISMATGPVDESQFKGVDPDEEAENAKYPAAAAGAGAGASKRKKRDVEQEEGEEEEEQPSTKGASPLVTGKRKKRTPEEEEEGQEEDGEPSTKRVKNEEGEDQNPPDLE